MNDSSILKEILQVNISTSKALLDKLEIQADENRKIMHKAIEDISKSTRGIHEAILLEVAALNENIKTLNRNIMNLQNTVQDIPQRIKEQFGTSNTNSGGNQTLDITINYEAPPNSRRRPSMIEDVEVIPLSGNLGELLLGELLRSNGNQ